jgi:hypothetical protein
MSSSENKIPALPATLFCGHCDPRLPHLISAFDVLLLGQHLLLISSGAMRVCCSSLPTSRFDRICSKNMFTYQCNRHLSCKGCFHLKAMS